MTNETKSDEGRFGAGADERALAQLFGRLGESPFRRRFRLRGRELEYLRRKGLDVVLEHAADFVKKRLAPAAPANDGRQTPTGNHPVFVAQHATATCCRGCLAKWHAVPKGRPLDETEKRYVVAVIRAWLVSELEISGQDDRTDQRS